MGRGWADWDVGIRYGSGYNKKNNKGREKKEHTVIAYFDVVRECDHVMLLRATNRCQGDGA